ncbi:hypothetical protein BMJ34_04115 [Sinorhizobium medicae]|uniref:Uncharacterized protein n=1 Tax=Sinorhizobium medicae TaxID=110321 RepID=A0ABX4TGM4_9HYPH|nr:hypothetical protein BMJ33_27350 [Sinorhizobium medicae]PLU07717.1 hypothetical protein BMJ34_04115 [Sinorhizobium medicae]PLU16965.1 hypothetical protein BMJ30_16010 [Sinorhizobium medicae]PLU17250.1 hypothetical protein BMJ29_21530 [Sinorhizobium medicae]PLU34063.1 hypothetical protein BMJ27_15620 [Sinorhizobium medicae]
MIQLFLLKHDLRYVKHDLRYSAKSWPSRHRTWLRKRHFEHHAQQIAFQSYLNRQEQAEARKRELEQIRVISQTWSLENTQVEGRFDHEV